MISVGALPSPCTISTSSSTSHNHYLAPKSYNWVTNKSRKEDTQSTKN